MRSKASLLTLSLTTLGIFATVAPVYAQQYRITVENLAPTNGTRLTPVWFGFHDGTFDLFNNGEAANVALERIAEDGTLANINSFFAGSMTGTVQGAISNGGPINPGQSASMMVTLNPATSRFFSYASMVIPSNDFFIANDNPTAFQVFDTSGNFTSVSFVVMGSMVRDAGTEVNDEIPANTAAFGQMMPNTGVDENGNVMFATGFQGAGADTDGPILTAFPNADFTAPGYQIARISITAVAPEPGTMVLLTLGLLPVAGLVRRRK